jgi:2-amino-4-hydroxy-6-hydroxymethyldihydropteridine diphosphokinase
MICYIGVGSNLGDRLENIQKAVALLEKTKGVKIRRASPLYETEPWKGAGKQGDYFNLVLELDCLVTPERLLEELKGIEKKVGRKLRKRRWASREIDLDILFFDHLTLRGKRLCVPHPLIQERFFVLKPLADVAPDLKHPLWPFDVKTMLSSLKETGHWRKLDEEIIPKH